MKSFRNAMMLLLPAVLSLLMLAGCPTKPKEEPILNEEGYRYKDVRILWLGHDGFRITTQKIAVYIDPCQVREGPKGSLVLISSDKPDHLDIPTLGRLMAGDTLLVAPENASKKLAYRFSAIAPGEEIRHKWLRVKAVNVAGKSPPAESQAQLGYIVYVEGVTIFFAGDVASADDLSGDPDIEQLKSKLDILMVPIGGSHSMNEDGAAAVARMLAPKIVIPMHYGVFPDCPGNPDALRRKMAGEYEIVTTR